MRRRRDLIGGSTGPTYRSACHQSDAQANKETVPYLNRLHALLETPPTLPARRSDGQSVHPLVLILLGTVPNCSCRFKHLPPAPDVAWHDIVGCEVAILGWVPVRGYERVSGLEVVEAADNFSVRTVLPSLAVDPFADGQ